jgi:hypothetical protein
MVSPFTRALAVSTVALSVSCGDSASDPGTASTSTATFTISAVPNAIRISPGGSAVSVVTIRGGQPPLSVLVGNAPNGVTVRVASTNDVTAFKLIITTDAAVVLGTYAIGVRCTSSDDRAPATTQVTLTIAIP